MADLISRQAAIKEAYKIVIDGDAYEVVQVETLMGLPSAESVEIVRCHDCKHNPNDTWFECPISHLPYNEDRWCWKGERKDG